MAGLVEALFIAPRGGEPMQTVDRVEAEKHSGLYGDRYHLRTGYWTNIDECEVTLINAEDLDDIRDTTGIAVQGGEHRRNIVVRGIPVNDLLGARFRIGGALFAGVRPRPPCSYIQKLTEPGMTKALARCGGICASVLEAGAIATGDTIEIQ